MSSRLPSSDAKRNQRAADDAARLPTFMAAIVPALNAPAYRLRKLHIEGERTRKGYGLVACAVHNSERHKRSRSLLRASCAGVLQGSAWIWTTLRASLRASRRHGRRFRVSSYVVRCHIICVLAGMLGHEHVTAFHFSLRLRTGR